MVVCLERVEAREGPIPAMRGVWLEGLGDSVRGPGESGWELWTEFLETEPPPNTAFQKGLYVNACENALNVPVTLGGCLGLNHAVHLLRGCTSYSVHVLSASGWRHFFRPLAAPQCAFIS